jgi:hypothetical protein
MSEQRTLKPVEGRLVRHPGDDKRPLDPLGEPVEFNSYWRRKLNAGDVVESKAKPAEAVVARSEPFPADAEKAAPKGGAK